MTASTASHRPPTNATENKHPLEQRAPSPTTSGSSTHQGRSLATALSRPSRQSSSRETEAVRTAVAHGLAIPLGHRRQQRARTAPSTRARCTDVGSAGSTRPTPHASEVAFARLRDHTVEMEPAHRIGPEPGQPLRHRPTCCLLAPAAARRPDRFDHDRNAGRICTGVEQLPRPASRGRRARRHPSAPRAAPPPRERQQRGERGRTSSRATFATIKASASSSRPSPRAAEVAMTGTPPSPSSSSSRRTSESAPRPSRRESRRCG